MMKALSDKQRADADYKNLLTESGLTGVEVDLHKGFPDAFQAIADATAEAQDHNAVLLQGQHIIKNRELRDCVLAEIENERVEIGDGTTCDRFGCE